MLKGNDILLKSDPNPFEGVIGFFEIQKINPEGKVVQTEYAKNIITYTATNIFAHSLGGDQTFLPTHIHVGGSLPINVPGVFPTVARSDTGLDASTDPGGLPGNVRAQLPIISQIFTGVSTVGAPTGQQNNNVVTFTALMPQFPDDPSLAGKSFYEAGIITKIGSTDLLFSHQFHTAITKQDGFQLVYSWSIRFF